MSPAHLIGNGIGFMVLIALVILVCIVVVQSPLPKPLRVLIVTALILRIVGAAARFLVLVVFYDGVGDAVGYYTRGVYFANLFQNLDWSPFTDTQYWWDRKWWGTTPMFWLSGIVISFIGRSMLGEFIVFALLGFLGLSGFVVAFRQSFPSVPVHRYARWVWLLPSLWFWPSSVGKESVTLLGLGLAVMGFSGRRDSIRWLPFALGIGIMLIIRPQVAALFFGLVLLAYWLGRGRVWSPRKTLQATAIAAISVVVLGIGLRSMRIESFDVEGMQEYMERESGRTVGGGSSTEATEVGPLGVPVAIVNVLFRPFPWEADSVVVLASSLEVILLWTFVLFRWRDLIRSLRGWRSNRLLCLSAAFVVVYTVALGMMVANLGIIARQRIFLFPFLFIFLEASVPTVLPARRRPLPVQPRQRPPAGAGQGGPAWPEPRRGIPGHSSSP